MDVTGKNIVVTGGGNGIGRALAERFAQEGAGHVTVADLDAKSAAAVADSVGGTAAGVDVGNREAIVDLVQSVERAQGPIDLFASNAGILTPGSIEASVDSWQKIWDVNVMAHVHAAHAVLPGMLERGQGAFLNTCSAAGLLTQIGSAPYSVTKHASVAFAEWLSITYGDRGIRVFALCPQAVNTNMTAGTESGGVHRCFLHAAPGGGAAAGATIDRSPVVASYEPHSGVVHDLDFSAHHRNLFASTASDGALRLYNMLQAAPLLRLEPAAAGLSRVRWSKLRPTRLVAAGLDGALYIFDLHESKQTAQQVVRPPEAAGRAGALPQLCALEISAEHEFLATGDSDGVVRVYGGGGEGSIGVQDTKAQLEALERLVVADVEE